MGGRNSKNECILIEAHVAAENSRHIEIGTILPVQFTSESGISLPLVNGTVVSTSTARSSTAGDLWIEISLLLTDLTRAPGRR